MLPSFSTLGALWNVNWAPLYEDDIRQLPPKYVLFQTASNYDLFQSSLIPLLLVEQGVGIFP